MSQNRKKLIAIDGNSLLFRAFFALPGSIATRDGQPTNAVYGFATMLLKLLKEEKPDAVAVAWDRAAPTFRHEAFEDYKAHRAEIPADLPSQFPLAKDLLAALDIKSFEIDGYEADDILAKLAVEAPRSGYDVLIVTGDKDALQLVNDNVKVMTTRKGITDTLTYDEAAVRERFGVGPEGVPDILGLMGDSSDNIPGVPGVGIKTAIELLQRFGTLDGVYENIDEITKPKLKESLSANEDRARLSRELAVLQPEIPIDIDYGVLARAGADKENARALFNKLEFRTLANRLDDPGLFQEHNLFTISAETAKPEPAPMADALPVKGNEEAFRRAARDHESAFELVDTAAGLQVGVAFASGLNFWGAAGAEAIGEFLADPTSAKVCHDLKHSAKKLASVGIRVEGIAFDTMLAAYLIDPGRKSYSLTEEAEHYLGVTAEAPADGVSAACSAATCLALKAAIAPKIDEAGLGKLLVGLEIPLSIVLAAVEMTGSKVDAAVLRKMSGEMAETLTGLEKRLYGQAGHEFNLGSPQQLAIVLFDELKLPPTKKGKKGYSTDAGVLAKLAGQHPIVENILAWRELSKLKSTYLDALPKLIDPTDGRIHTNLNQVGTSTGRLSSDKPNLQNIPVKGEWGAKIRAAFIPGEPDWEILAADYSQIELRVLASLASDEAMLKAFADDIDIHTATAAEVSGVPLTEVSPGQRRIAKEVNFGLMYGMSSYGLSERLGISPGEADDYIKRYFDRYPTIRAYIDSVIEKAKTDGFVETVMGRRRYIRELSSSDFNTRRQGERFAVNAVIQGSAADIIKMAMVNIYREFSDNALKSRMFLQVHDELLFEVPPEEKQPVYDLVEDEMENAFTLRAHLKVNLAYGKNWGDIDK